MNQHHPPEDPELLRALKTTLTSIFARSSYRDIIRASVGDNLFSRFQLDGTPAEVAQRLILVLWRDFGNTGRQALIQLLQDIAEDTLDDALQTNIQNLIAQLQANFSNTPPPTPSTSPSASPTSNPSPTPASLPDADPPSAPPPQALILKGGGVKGLAFAGAIEVLERAGYTFDTFAGTSAGAIAAVLLGAGYRAQDLKTILETTDFQVFTDAPWYRAPFHLLRKGGLYPGAALSDWIQERLSERVPRASGVRMRDLPTRVVVYAANAQRGILAFDTQDENSDLNADFAVRCSLSIPFFFMPPSLNDQRVYDGGMLANFPVKNTLERLGHDRFIGLYLGTRHQKVPKRTSIIRELIDIFLNRDERVVLDQYQDRIIVIDPGPVRTTDFRLSSNDKQFLYHQGRAAAFAYLQAQDTLPTDLKEDAEDATREAQTYRQRAEADRTARRRRRIAGWVLAGALILGAVFWMLPKGALNNLACRWQDTGEVALNGATVTLEAPTGIDFDLMGLQQLRLTKVQAGGHLIKGDSLRLDRLTSLPKDGRVRLSLEVNADDGQSLKVRAEHGTLAVEVYPDGQGLYADLKSVTLYADHHAAVPLLRGGLHALTYTQVKKGSAQWCNTSIQLTWDQNGLHVTR